MSISFIRDFLFFFNIKQEDLPKLISYSEELERNRQFVLENKKYFEQNGKALFSSHMLDLSAEPLEENMKISKKYLVI